jgi:hypothetical protein
MVFEPGIFIYEVFGERKKVIQMTETKTSFALILVQYFFQLLYLLSPGRRFTNAVTLTRAFAAYQPFPKEKRYPYSLPL